MQTMSRQELNAMVGCALVGPGGEKLGKITDVYVDERTRQPEWLAVSTGMFGLKESFVPLSGVQRRGNEYESPFSKDPVKGAMTRSEEELRVGKATEQRGQARLRKWVETEHVSDTVPIAREEARIVREPITTR